MKKAILLFLILLLSLTELATDNVYAGKQARVYVVMSSTAYAYHSSITCTAVRKAKHPVKQVTLDEATRKMNRQPCRICYGE